MLLGLVLACVGLAAATAASTRLTRAGRPAAPTLRPGVIVPLGALAFASLPPVWDFATSGLETGLTFAWIGVTYLALVATTNRGAGRHVAPAALLVGLGPLIRPDLAVMAIGFALALALAIAAGRPGARRVVGVVLLAALPAAAYELFRMGYYAALVPNSALAKEAGLADWSRGWTYGADFVVPYRLWIPLAAVAAVLALDGRRLDRRLSALVVAPVAAGLVHALYVVRAGGDFMHARLFLPSLMTLLLPVMATRLPDRAMPRATAVAKTAALVVLAAWSAVCATALRVPYAGSVSARNISDERGYYVAAAGRAHPIRIEDFRETAFGQAGVGVQMITQDPSLWAETYPAEPSSGGDSSRAVVIDHADRPPPTALRFEDCRRGPLNTAMDPRVRLVVTFPVIGIVGYMSASSIHVVDRYGLSDPIGSRLTITARGRAGHEKLLPNAWVLARFSPAVSDGVDSLAIGPDSSAVTAARRALRCGLLVELLDAVAEPLTLHRFVRNVALAPQLTRLRIPANAHDAERAFCGTQRRKQ